MTRKKAVVILLAVALAAILAVPCSLIAQRARGGAPLKPGPGPSPASGGGVSPRCV